ncbi:PRC-barrel domain-containing protein [Geobacillus sp. TFV-3]|uniref:PRC-barrel domain-containing protein n=1 Tax=Geobacillus sp. TFV-3 TaxID=1897059 RepID=UPI001356F55F|nr:PRC-barrel domain-containing protein [Geobacillus sp. TFV-3]KAF0994360.1 hypothetical protein BJQ97_01002 [Geobacillus sp. TFV-3]
MRTFSDIKGLPLYEQTTGKMVGTIADIWFTSHGAVKGLVAERGGLFGRRRYLPLSAVQSFEKDRVIICDADSFQPFPSFDSGHSLYGERGLAGSMVVAADGTTIGLLDDVYFDGQLGKIDGYEISEGFFSDLTEGKKRMELAPFTAREGVVTVETTM